MRMQVFIVNLDRYKEDQVRGSWFEPPIDLEEMRERIGLDEKYKEYAIFDYDLPFEIDESTPVSDINRICGIIAEIEGSPLYDALSEVQRHWFSNIEELIENIDDIMYYPSSEDLTDVAKVLVENIADIPSQLQKYMDYEAYARDLDSTGNFVMTSRGIFEYKQ